MATARDIAKFFLMMDSQNEGNGISNLKLQKLVYYAQGFFCAIYGRPLFIEPIEAWTHGPVVPDIYHQYKAYGSNLIPFAYDFNISSLTKDEIDLSAEVFRVFGQFEAWKLRDMTHEEAPWINNEKTASEISIDEMMRYFKTRLN